jgi:phage tail sheath protein FI
MAEYLHPGVYVEETSFRAKPIEGVSTSTAGLVGRTRKGPEGRPTLVTSFTQFVREFGAPFAAPAGLGAYLGHAVRAFFENGGRRAYIVRVLADDAAPATSDDPVDPNLVGVGTVLRLPPTATVIGPTTQLPLDSLRGIETSGGLTSISIYTRSTPTAPATLRGVFPVQSWTANRNTLTLGAPITEVLNPATTFIRVNGAAPESGHVDGPVVTARSRGAGGNDLAVEFRPRDLPPVRITPRRLTRNRPIVGSTGVDGPNPGDPTHLTLDAAASRQLRAGDTIEFIDGERRVIQSIGAGTLTAGGPVGGSDPAKNYAGATVTLIRRPPAAAAATPIVLTTAGAVNMTASPFVTSHGLAAVLRPGDQIEVDDGADNATFTVGVATVGTAALNVTLASAIDPGADYTSTPVRLVETAATGALTRLVVADATGLTAPYQVPPEPIAVLAGAAADESAIELVDVASNQIYVTRTNPPVPASGDFPDAADNASWTAIESLVLGNGGTLLRVASTAGVYVGAILEVDTGTAKHSAIVQAVDPTNRELTLVAAIPAFSTVADAADRRAFVRVLELDVLVYERDAGAALVLKETFANLSWNHDSGAASFSRYYVDRINDSELGSKLISIAAPAGPPPVTARTQPTTDEGFPVFLINGTDGSPLEAIHLIGRDDGPNQRFGIQALAERKDIALVAVPGVTDEIVQQALITHCELLKYRFAVLDGRPAESNVTDILAHRNNYDTKYAGYYAPWLSTVDLSTGRTLIVPPSGYVLGICARVDNERGVHKAPANEVVRGILDVELPFTDGEQDVLNPLGVNLTREFEGRGIRVWGARTLSSDPEWKYVNVRRLFIFLEHSIDNGTQWVVFEPNNEALWARVRSTIESFLFGVWKTGALMGTKPEDAFFVRCDRSTMTQDDIDNGRLVCLIGVAPTYPAEFVIFRIGQFTASSNLS